MMSTCPQCQQEFKNPRKFHFCSRACVNRALKTKKVEVLCQQCQRSFRVVPSRAKSRLYCSRKCAAQQSKNCLKAPCQLALTKTSYARFAKWWAKQVQAVVAAQLTPQQAFRAGYRLGHRRGRNRIQRTA